LHSCSLIGDLVKLQAKLHPTRPALLYKDQSLSYAQLKLEVDTVAQGLLGLGLLRGERVGVYLPKQVETVTGLLGSAEAGGVFVPINPLLKPTQVAHILRDCNVRILITSAPRLQLLCNELTACKDLSAVIVAGEPAAEPPAVPQQVLVYSQLANLSQSTTPHRRIDTDIAAILYTSGSTGSPKGVVLSHRNMMAGAKSVASYLNNSAEDRVLALLPLSFDAGLSQLTSMLLVGGSTALMDYLLPRDVINACERYQVSGLAAVPTIWNQLAPLEWPPAVTNRLRYITNTGGIMPVNTTRRLQSALPNTDIYLMYGLTEAFRSTYLPPEQVSQRPDSIGKAVPNAEILVINENGKECAPNEPGELVHKGTLVAQGYWNDPVKTAERFKPAPLQVGELPLTEMAVWSGDRVRKDEEGYLYFISRMDEMIKTSGYRVSPTEVEEVVYASGLVTQVAALGLPHPMLGQGILLVACVGHEVTSKEAQDELITHCKRELPNFMVPLAIELMDTLPLNQNGKIDRKRLSAEFADHFQEH